MVATVIMAVAIVGLLAGITGALRNAARLTDYDRTVQLARLQMNELLVNPGLPRNTVFDGAFDPQQTGGRPAGWRARLENFEMPPFPSPGQMALDRLELQVWWISGSERRTFTLDAFRPYRLKPEDIPPGVPQ
jgi:hypothetical protein